MRVPSDEAPALSRLDGIDTLRGLSILAVVLLHIWIRLALDDVRMGRSWPPTLSHFVWFNGGNGVTVFFAVSGFLITLTSLRRFGSLAAMRPVTFYRIRFARIMPLLVLLLVVLSAFHLLHVDGFRLNAKHFTLPRALLAALTFHLNWLETARDSFLPACWTVLWSLSPRRGVLSLLSTGVRGAVALEVRFLALDKRGPCVRGNGAVCTHGLVDDRSCEGELVSRRHGQHRAGMPNSVDNGHAVATQCAARKVAACNTDSGLGDDSTHRHLADLAPHLAATGQEWNRRHSARARDVPGDASGGAGWS